MLLVCGLSVVKKVVSQATWVHKEALLSIFVALSQTLNETIDSQLTLVRVCLFKRDNQVS